MAEVKKGGGGLPEAGARCCGVGFLAFAALCGAAAVIAAACEYVPAWIETFAGANVALPVCTQYAFAAARAIAGYALYAGIGAALIIVAIGVLAGRARPLLLGLVLFAEIAALFWAFIAVTLPMRSLGVFVKPSPPAATAPAVPAGEPIGSGSQPR